VTYLPLREVEEQLKRSDRDRNDIAREILQGIYFPALQRAARGLSAGQGEKGARLGGGRQFGRPVAGR
jgi:hypothetical protein